MSNTRRTIVIDTPHVTPEEAGPRDAESRAVAAHPEFQALIAEGRRNRAAGKGLSADEVFGEAAAKPVGAKGNSATSNGHVSPKRAHRETVSR
jgi:hypothetical protein